jgi:hypothetical protein
MEMADAPEEPAVVTGGSTEQRTQMVHRTRDEVASAATHATSPPPPPEMYVPPVSVKVDAPTD